MADNARRTLILLLAFTITACGRESPTEPVAVPTPTPTPVVTTLSGTIYLVNGNGVRFSAAPGAWVVFRGAGESTGSTGRYNFGIVSPGPGTLTAGGLLGFQTVTVLLVIAPGPNVVDVDLR